MVWSIYGLLCNRNPIHTVIDMEAGDILLDYIDRYYYDSSLSEDNFQPAFDKASERIMTVTKSLG